MHQIAKRRVKKMNNDEWSFDFENAQLERELPTEPEILTIVPVEEKQIDFTIDGIKTNYFGSIFGRPNKSEVQVLRTETKYYPYLIIVGRYIARFLRRNKYECKVESDVVSVKIKDEVIDVDNKAVTISSLVAKGVSGLTIGGGVIGFSCQPIEGALQKGFSAMLGEKYDKTLMNNKNFYLSLMEQAIYDTKDKTLCFDASTASIVEKPDVLKLIRKATRTIMGRPSYCKEVLDFKKAVTVTEHQLVKFPESRILEHLFKVSALSLVFWPIVHITLQCRGVIKELYLNGIDLSVLN